jgi:two-component system OmpR family sensor kinase
MRTLRRSANGNGRATSPPVTPQVAEFVATAAHELRTPLTVVSGLASTLRQFRGEMSDDNVDRALDSILRQSRRMNALIENLLDLAQLQAGHVPPRARLALAELVGDALELAPPPGSTTVRLLESEPGLVVSGDRMSLVRLLVNLLANAYHYGGPEIVIEMGKDASHAVVVVADDGDGVPPELVPTLFEPFTRGANVGTVVGSGLGLALSHRLAASVGSQLSYGPAEPRGARFVVRVPLARAG